MGFYLNTPRLQFLSKCNSFLPHWQSIMLLIKIKYFISILSGKILNFGIKSNQSKFCSVGRFEIRICCEHILSVCLQKGCDTIINSRQICVVKQEWRAKNDAGAQILYVYTLLMHFVAVRVDFAS